jgi:hypothetical protein
VVFSGAAMGTGKFPRGNEIASKSSHASQPAEGVNLPVNYCKHIGVDRKILAND